MKTCVFSLFLSTDAGFCEWRVDSFCEVSQENAGFLRISLRNFEETHTLLRFEIAKRPGIPKADVNFHWILLDNLLRSWLETQDFSTKFAKYQENHAISKKFLISLEKTLKNQLTISDFECLENFVEKLSFVLSVLGRRTRKTVGKSWVFSPKCKENPVIVQVFKQHLREKREFLHKTACFQEIRQEFKARPQKNSLYSQRSLKNPENQAFPRESLEKLDKSQKILEKPSVFLEKLEKPRVFARNVLNFPQQHLNGLKKLKTSVFPGEKPQFRSFSQVFFYNICNKLVFFVFFRENIEK